jgi:hypothetical protein
MDSMDTPPNMMASLKMTPEQLQELFRGYKEKLEDKGNLADHKVTVLSEQPSSSSAPQTQTANKAILSNLEQLAAKPTKKPNFFERVLSYIKQIFSKSELVFQASTTTEYMTTGPVGGNSPSAAISQMRQSLEQAKENLSKNKEITDNTETTLEKLTKNFATAETFAKMQESIVERPKLGGEIATSISKMQPKDKLFIPISLSLHATMMVLEKIDENTFTVTQHNTGMGIGNHYVTYDKFGRPRYQTALKITGVPVERLSKSFFDQIFNLNPSMVLGDKGVTSLYQDILPQLGGTIEPASDPKPGEKTTFMWSREQLGGSCTASCLKSVIHTFFTEENPQATLDQKTEMIKQYKIVRRHIRLKTLYDSYDTLVNTTFNKTDERMQVTMEMAKRLLKTTKDETEKAVLKTIQKNIEGMLYTPKTTWLKQCDPLPKQGKTKTVTLNGIPTEIQVTQEVNGTRVTSPSFTGTFNLVFSILKEGDMSPAAFEKIAPYIGELSNQAQVTSNDPNSFKHLLKLMEQIYTFLPEKKLLGEKEIYVFGALVSAAFLFSTKNDKTIPEKSGFYKLLQRFQLQNTVLELHDTSKTELASFNRRTLTSFQRKVYLSPDMKRLQSIDKVPVNKALSTYSFEEMQMNMEAHKNLRTIEEKHPTVVTTIRAIYTRSLRNLTIKELEKIASELNLISTIDKSIIQAKNDILEAIKNEYNARNILPLFLLKSIETESNEEIKKYLKIVKEYSGKDFKKLSQKEKDTLKTSLEALENLLPPGSDNRILLSEMKQNVILG